MPRIMIVDDARAAASVMTAALESRCIDIEAVPGDREFAIHNYYPVDKLDAGIFKKERTYPTLRQHIRGHRG